MKDKEKKTNESSLEKEDVLKENLKSDEDVEKNKAITYLAYLNVFCLIPLFLRKNSDFAQFHARQGLVLVLFWFFGVFLLPVYGIGAFICLGVIALSIFGLLQVNDGEKKPLPLVYDVLKIFDK